MTFTKTFSTEGLSPIQKTKSSIQAKIIREARTKIILYPLKTKELQLDEYFKTNLKKSLKTICLDIISGIKVYLDGDQLTIKFLDKTLDKQALFITYGNSEIYGSNILKDVLK